MVLADLGRRLNAALSQLNQSPLIDDQVLDALLKEIAAALLESDVNVKLVAGLRNSVKATVKASIEAGADRGKESNRRAVAQKAIFDELVKLVDPGVQPYQPKKGKPNVIMAVGLQVRLRSSPYSSYHALSQLAVHYQRRGFKSAIVCADTFRAGAFDQTRQSATKAKVAYFGSYTETDPVAIAAEGVAKFKKERFDVIIVDTSGRHRQESELFQEMVQIGEAVKPDMTVLVLDASIGQAAEAQSRAFKESADFGAIIVTKMDGHAKGGGAISAVAVTKTPIIFLGVGEHLNDLEKFSPEPFISKLLGMGDLQGLMEHMQSVAMANPERQKDMVKNLEEGKLSIRDWREQIQNVMGMGSISKIASMIPGVPPELFGAGGEEDVSRRMKRMMIITDSMTAAELDSDGMIFLDMEGKEPVGVNWRITRVAKGSGSSVREVEELLCQYLMMSNMAKQVGGKNGWLVSVGIYGTDHAHKSNTFVAGFRMSAAQKMQAAMGPPKGPNGMPTREQIAAAQRSLPPGMLQKMRQGGAAGGMQEMMKAMMGGNVSDEEMAEMQRMMGGMGGMGGPGGMPDLASMMKNLGGLGGMGGFPGFPGMGGSR
ncbi:signal recognition particle protein [Clavulina sp. PMI_390]|nr:signal recognition particle protein [Clavulina sp. PMI_390]